MLARASDSLAAQVELKVVPEASHGFLHMPIGHALQLQLERYNA